MSVIQGTTVLITGTFLDPDTNQPFDPPDVLATITPPAGDGPPVNLAFSTGGLAKLAVGKYRLAFDTSPAPGSWEWELASTGNLAIVKRGIVTVRAR